MAKRFLAFLAGIALTAAPALAQTAVFSADTSSLDLAGLQSLQADPRLQDWAELGNRLLVAGEDPAEEALRERGLRPERLPGTRSLEGLVLVLSRHSGVASILGDRARIVVKEGPYHLVKPTVTGLNRLLQEHEGDFQVKFLPLGRRRVVFRSPEHLAEVAPADPAVAPFAAAVDRARYEATLKKLIAFKTRYTFSPGLVEAANWAVEQFKSMGYDAKIVTYTNRGKQLPNVVAEAKGSSRPQELFVVGAHLDSIAWDSGTNAPGADDNGSGSAGVLEMARVLAGRKPEATIRFVLFSGEEQGLHGSIAYAQQLQSAGELSKVKAMINLDMIAFDKKAPVDVMLEGKVISHALSDRLQANGKAHAPGLAIYRTDDAWGSDHVPFLDRNVPATLTIEYEYDNNSNEHSPRDVFEICNLDLAVAILRMDVTTLAELAGVR